MSNPSEIKPSADLEDQQATFGFNNIQQQDNINNQSFEEMMNENANSKFTSHNNPQKINTSKPVKMKK